MTNNNPRRDHNDERTPETNKLDRELDAALAKFTAVGPRTGLEDRILANLRAEQKRAMEHSRWRWPVMAALAVVIVVSVSIVWRSGKSAPNTAAYIPITAESAGQSATQVANNNGSGSIRPHEMGSGRRLKSGAVHPATVVAPVPKLEHFPSPQPLSDQEAILVRYITNYPQHAALIAQARTEALSRDRAEEMRDGAHASDGDSQQ
jgi:hypothetical protein